MKHFLIILQLLVSMRSFAQQQPYWHNITSGTHKKLLSISFGNVMTGYIGGVDSLFLKTSDGGESWQNMSLNGGLLSASANDIVDVNFVSGSVGYITVTNSNFPLYQGAVYKTIDGGNSWTLVDAGNTAAYRNFFLAEEYGWIIGSAFFSGNVVTKIEAGLPTDYHYFSNNPDSFNISLDFLDGQTGIIGNTNGQVYRTIDGGNSWITVQASTAYTAIRAIRFLNNSTVLAATDGVLLISHDTGLSWDIDVNNLTFDYPVMKSIALSKKDSFITVGSGVTNPDQGLIYWHDHNFNQREVVNQPLYSVAMANDSIAYAVGDSGLIVTNRTAAVVGINDPALLGDQLKIYPNPNWGEFFVELPCQHTLSIYDYNGKSVLEESNKALRHYVDIAPLPKGVYLVELNVAGEKISRKITYR